MHLNRPLWLFDGKTQATVDNDADDFQDLESVERSEDGNETFGSPTSNNVKPCYCEGRIVEMSLHFKDAESLFLANAQPTTVQHAQKNVVVAGSKLSISQSGDNYDEDFELEEEMASNLRYETVLECTLAMR